MSAQIGEDTLLAIDRDPELPWTQWMNSREMKIVVEFAMNDCRQQIAATRTTKFIEIKEMICRTCCATTDQLILWWMGQEMQNDMTLEDAFGWRAFVETTLHCEDREQRADRGVKRSRSRVDLSSISGVDLCTTLHPRSK